MVRILVVDDSTTMQKVVRIAFSKYTAQVFAVSSIAQALAHIASQVHPQLLIIDSAISGTNSLTDLLRLKKELPPETKFLLLTSSHFQIDEKKFKDSLFEFFLKKPFESNELVSLVGSLLGSQLQLKSRDDSPLTPSLNTGTPVEEPMIQFQLPPTPVALSLDSTDESLKSAAFSKTVMIPPPPGLGQTSFDLLSQNSSFAASEGSVGESLRITQEIKLPPPPSIPFNPSSLPPVNPSMEFSNVHHTIDSPNRPPLPTSSHVPSEAELHKHLKALVEEYCRRNFGEIAKEVIAKELRKLADEKVRSLLE